MKRMQRTGVMVGVVVGLVILILGNYRCDADTRPGMVGTNATVAAENAFGSMRNGVCTIPDHDLSENSVFRFSDESLQKDPSMSGNMPLSEDQFFRTLRDGGVGDLLYDDAEGGTLVIASERVMLLGEGLLTEVKGTIVPKWERSGVVRARIACRYLIKTLNGKYAIGRVLAMTSRSIVVQWVYQPDGRPAFFESVLQKDAKIENVSLVADKMRNAIRELRRTKGLRICFEASGEERALKNPLRLAYENVSLGDLLDALVEGTGNIYQWELVPSSDMVVVFPRLNSLLSNKVGAVKQTGSWLELIETADWRAAGIQFPPEFAEGPAVPLPRDKVISLTDGDPIGTVRDLLKKACIDYGEGLYFEVWPHQGSKAFLYFMGTKSVSW